MYSCHFSTEKVLEESGISVAAPEQQRSGQISLQGKVYQDVSHGCHNSDISADSGSDYEQSSSSSNEESEVPQSDEKELDEEVSMSLVINDWASCYIDCIKRRQGKREGKREGDQGVFSHFMIMYTFSEE